MWLAEGIIIKYKMTVSGQKKGMSVVSRHLPEKKGLKERWVAQAWIQAIYTHQQ